MTREKSTECAATLILEIQGVINSIMNLERKASRKMLLQRAAGQQVDTTTDHQKHLEHFLDLSTRAQEMQVAFSDLLKTQSKDGDDDHDPSSFAKMVSLFMKSAVVQDLHDEFQQLDKWNASMPKSATKVMNAVSFFEQHGGGGGGSSGHGHDDGAGASTASTTTTTTRNQTFFQDIYTSFSSELQHVADLEKRLRSRDHYLQDTISETAKRCHSLEQTIAELQSENEDLKNDYLNLEARMQMQPAGGVVGGGTRSSSKAISGPASMRAAAQLQASKGEKQEKEEREVSRWILELTNTTNQDKEAAAHPPPNQNQNRRKSEAERQDRKDTQELINLTQTLTTLAEEKELLEHDLTLVRLQVEHLEAISKERDAIIAEFMNRKCGSFSGAVPLTPISPVPLLQVDVDVNGGARGDGGVNGKRISAVPSIRSPLSPSRINSLSPMNRQSMLGFGQGFE